MFGGGVEDIASPTPTPAPCTRKRLPMELSDEKPNLTQMASQEVWEGHAQACEDRRVPRPVWYSMSLGGGPRLHE